MTVWEALAVAAAGGVGAAARYTLDNELKSRFSQKLRWAAPLWSLLVINACGSFALGAIMSAELGEFTTEVVGVGLCGGFTTFSTVMVETLTSAIPSSSPTPSRSTAPATARSPVWPSRILASLALLLLMSAVCVAAFWAGNHVF
ncbi:MAG TPA: CrcB family protein [Candidatus Corynebacterium gallistercoris]|uniref:Fluoride-specific ion channel n=1 Tax=Candidatus Corynebacterium gallistercoris TaxID=2838530 RepID=A0A9D1UPM1_9CORY|nr:CrcB family protein [Candidatus Corynebacterium gallistercoris]